MKSKNDQLARIHHLNKLIETQTGQHVVRPYRADGYVNLLNRYGTEKDTTEGYFFRPDPDVPDEVLTNFYEGNGLFAKIIDTPAEEAVKHGFSLKDMKDQKIEEFYNSALAELDWEDVAMDSLKWNRLYGGAIAVMLINDGSDDLAKPLDWSRIQSIDDIRVYDRSVVQPDYQSVFSNRSDDPFRTRGSRLGEPEYYYVSSRYGNFTVHESRCLVFRNGRLPENSIRSAYEFWGIPEYLRIQRAVRDTEIAHGSAVKLLDRSVQAIYKMKDLSALLATEQGESMVLKRLQVIDLARGLLNSMVIDNEGEDYEFKSFSYAGVSDVIQTTCNYLSALTSIPQTILFGRSPAGMNATGDADLENYYNYVQRIQSRDLRSNLRYLLSIIFQAGVATGEIDEIPKIEVEFNTLRPLSDTDQATLDQQKAQLQLTKAQIAQAYIGMQVIDPTEVRKKLADSDEFDVENMLDEYDEEELFENAPSQNPEGEGATPGMMPGQEGQVPEGEGVSVEPHNTDPGTKGSASTAAPAATKLPQDMSEQEAEKAEGDQKADYEKAVKEAISGKEKADDKAAYEEAVEEALKETSPEDSRDDEDGESLDIADVHDKESLRKFILQFAERTDADDDLIFQSRGQRDHEAQGCSSSHLIDAERSISP